MWALYETRELHMSEGWRERCERIVSDVIAKEATPYIREQQARLVANATVIANALASTQSELRASEADLTALRVSLAALEQDMDRQTLIAGANRATVRYWRDEIRKLLTAQKP